ncbi:unnamed protein product, partial [Ectocarpus sp. 8 AP-2014]
MGRARAASKDLDGRMVVHARMIRVKPYKWSLVGKFGASLPPHRGKSSARGSVPLWSYPPRRERERSTATTSPAVVVTKLSVTDRSTSYKSAQRTWFVLASSFFLPQRVPCSRLGLPPPVLSSRIALLSQVAVVLAMGAAEAAGAGALEAEAVVPHPDPSPGTSASPSRSTRGRATRGAGRGWAAAEGGKHI